MAEAQEARQTPDAQDVRRVLAGDPRAFEDLVRRWQTPVVTLAFRFCRDRHQAEDLAQTAFVTIYRKLAQWDGRGAFRSWLFAVATNVIRSELRRPRPAWVPLTDEPAAAHDARPEADDDERVRRLVGALPEPYRDTLVLFYFHGRDVRETAAQRGLRRGTVKARLHRGRELLRRALLQETTP